MVTMKELILLLEEKLALDSMALKTFIEELEYLK
jgi:hypothetical protein